MLKQLSIYAENKKGALQAMTNALYEAGINIWGSVTNDGAEYGRYAYGVLQQGM